MLGFDRPGHAVGPGGAARGRGSAIPHHVGELEPAGRSEDAEYLFEDARLVRRQVIAPFEITKSAQASPKGTAAMSATWTSAFLSPRSRALSFAISTMAGVISIPIARPRSPMSEATMQRSAPAPQPRSTTVSSSTIDPRLKGFPTAAADSQTTSGK